MVVTGYTYLQPLCAIGMEDWNNGFWEKGGDVFVLKIILARNLEWKTTFKTNIPSFQCSIIPVKNNVACCYINDIFSISNRISETFNYPFFCSKVFIKSTSASTAVTVVAL
jgi:hypothetical protein